MLPTAYARRLQIIPVKVEADKILFATSEPFDLDWIHEVQNVIKKNVAVVISSPKAIHHFIEEFFTVRAATQEFQREAPRGVKQEFGQVLELDRMLGKAKANDLGKNGTAVVRIVDWLFQFAHDERATDIHMEPRRGNGQVRFRIDGHMRVVYNFEPEMMLPIVSRIKILGEMAVDEKRKPQDGHIRYALPSGQEDGDAPFDDPRPARSEKMVIRIFDPKMAGKSFEDLGFAEADIKKWESLINLEPHGLVLVTGPTAWQVHDASHVNAADRQRGREYLHDRGSDRNRE